MTTSTPAPAILVEAVSADCYGQVRGRLRELVARLGAQGTTRLPSEAELAAALGVSRPTLRSALQSLQEEGRIRRLHGRGTFINRHAVGIRANLAEAGAFLDLLAQPSVHIAEQRVVPLDAEVSASLELPAGEPGLRIERVFHAGDTPAVHTVDLVPVRLLAGGRDRSPETLDATRSTFEFVRTHLGRPVCYSVAEVRPVLAPPEVATRLRLPATRPVLRLRHTHIQADERPVAVTVAHVNDDHLCFSVIRSHLDERS
ncbi:GntR family transcriptional regulator [Pseudonocardia acaciae]|uniref:GntR family transcriptional regulator n=1 Tax=Pseudonocardia acaciae TaxID=551276 RepID=UPI000491BA00|nr:GntR family transcriptional regulator [Pseudonocardia acaciae]